MLYRWIIAALGGMSTAILAIAPVSAETANFGNPMQGPNRLDWCVNWGQGCGAAAANAWCAANGYSNAVSFEIANDIGASTPTRLIGTGAVCDQAMCDGFKYITCSRPDPTQTFNNPMQGANRLDWCFNWGTGCGAEAAHAWCVAKGFAGATDFAIANNIGASSPTRLISTGAVCDQDFCDGFSHITCKH
ncbi:MAG TPA: hypothetical protein VFK86_03620 [Bauldia sp.]|nr:hypothetical protein [Bauldia sp.]